MTSANHGILALNVYPIKSCRAQAVQSVAITIEGPEGDRKWMIVDPAGKAMTQREFPAIATIQAHWGDAGLSVGLGKQFIVIPKELKNVKKVSVNLWDLNIDAAEESPLISQAISQYLSVPCKLVRYVDFSKRMAHSNNPSWQPEMRFPDGAPLLLVNQKSVDALNQKLAVPVPADRFRSNVLFNGSAAFEEDDWQRIRIGDVVFSNPKKCARCVMVTIDQQAGRKDGAEPLKTLAGFRRDGKSVNFGVLWIPENVGTIHSSDRMEVLT